MKKQNSTVRTSPTTQRTEDTVSGNCGCRQPPFRDMIYTVEYVEEQMALRGRFNFKLRCAYRGALVNGRWRH